MRQNHVNTLVLKGLLALLSVGANAQTAKGDLSSRALAILRDNCVGCHGGQKMSGLDLRTRGAALAGGKQGVALVVGNPSSSRLFRFVAGLDKTQMPPGKHLSGEQVATLKSWIKSGASWGDQRKMEATYWAFRPVTRPAVPKTPLLNPIDSFIASALKAKGLTLSPPADRRTLLRRAYFDMVGLPPTPEETQAFLADRSPNAYEKVVDRLIASPLYGERWARHWLDVARYAESNGFKTDEKRPYAWRYRDYVIDSFNSDKPYDRFIREQIAGDELYPEDPLACVATGFCSHWPDESNAQDLRQRRQDILNDITDTLGSTVLGLTVGCAKCHDHKYDPVSQKDYYRLQAYFAGVRPREDLVVLPSAEYADWRRKQSEWEGKTGEIRTQLASLEEPVRKRFFETRKARFPKEVQEAIETAPAKRTSLQWLLYHKAMPQLEMTDGDVASGMNGEKADVKSRWKELGRQLASFKSLKPDGLPLAQGITDVGAVVPKTFLLAGGLMNKPLEELQPGTLSAVATITPVVPIKPSTESSGRRAALAQWLTSPQNPLTARVMVNRVWHYHFGRGIVATPSDFGQTGERPTHPELLDWLTSEFTRHGWSLKRLHRLILTSKTYQQSSDFRPLCYKTDSDNRLLWRFRRQRMSGEVLRDTLLSVSGELNLQRGGVSVMPPLPADVTTRGYWKDATDPKESNRRSIYVFVKRNMRFPLFEAFDMPDTHEACARRQVTITPLQSLLLMNEATLLSSAKAFAERVLREAGGDSTAQVDRAYQLAFQREPSTEERNHALAFLTRQAEITGERLARNEKTFTPQSLPQGVSKAQGAAFVDFCHVLMNANEFVYVE